LNAFGRADGTRLQIVEGFRQRILSYRASVTPNEDWTGADYKGAAAKKQRRFRRLLAEAQRWLPSLVKTTVLDVGCGDGANCLQLALEPVREVIGIDLVLPLNSADAKGEQTRALAREILEGRPFPKSVKFQEMDATAMSFTDATFDWVISRSAMEHIAPAEEVLGEIARVTKPGGLIYLGIDPFYWVRGCHKRGVVDIPFAHARMNLDDYARFVEVHEDSAAAAKRRRRLETLNRFTVQQWRTKIETMPCEILSWENRNSEVGQSVLAEHPDIPESVLPGVSTTDLLCERLEVWLRRR